MTESKLPTAQKTVGKWLASNAGRGAIEQIALDLPEMPDNMNAGQKAEWLAKTIGVGMVSELVGQGVMQGSGKVLKKVGDTKVGKVAQEQVAKLFDYLATARRRNTIPVRRSLTETVPMWREKLSIKRTNTPEDKRVLSQMGYGSQSAAGGLAGAEPYQDENGNWKMRFNPEKAALGIAAMGGIKAIKGNKAVFGNMKPVEFDGKYTSGDISKLTKSLDEALGTESFNGKGKWTSEFAARQTAKQQLEYDAQESPEMGKLLEYVNGLEGQIAKAQGLASQSTAKKVAIQQKRVLPVLNTQKTSLRSVSENASTSVPIIPPEKLYIEGSPITKGQQKQFDREWEQSLNDYANGITRQSGGGVSVEPSLKTKQKLKIKSEKAALKTHEQEYREWQKQLFGENNVRTERKAVDALAKSMQTSTNESSLGLKNAANWKDKPKILLTRETMERNFEDIMGADAPVLKKKILEPIFKAEADRTKFLTTERAQIKALGIKPRSKESALVQQLGEGKITESQVRQQSKNADKIITAQKVLREKYDTYLTELNKVLTRNGYEPIPKRKDYFHHFEDLSGLFEQVGVSLKATDLPTDINGLSADFKPGKTFFNAALQRKGDESAIDAITGMDKYLEGASNQMYHTDNIQRLRNFETVLREKYAGTNHLTNFAAELTEYTNALAGKKAMIDRAAESVVGRKIYAGATALKKQTGANMVGANLSSALTSFIPVTQTLATTSKKSVVQAALGILKSTFKDDGFIDNSNFLTSRVGADRLSMTNWEKIGDKGFWLFKVFDNFTSQLAVRSKYLEGLDKGLSESAAMLRADEWGRKTLAGRSAGEMPTLFNSKTLGFFTQFQLEVNNQISFMAKDIPRNFNKIGAASALAQLFVYSYFFNELYEKTTGRRPAFDPLGVAQRSFEDYTNPDMKKGQATKNLVGSVSQQLPFTSMLEGGRIPIGAALPDLMGLAKGETNLKKELTKPLVYLLPPTGGGQIKKSLEGIGAFNRGYSQSPSGAARFPIEQTPSNQLKTGLFGQWSTPEAQQYIREGRNVLGEKQTQVLQNKTGQGAMDYYKSVIDKRNADNTTQEVKDGTKKSSFLDSIFGNKAEASDSQWESYFEVPEYTALPESTNQQKALKEDKRQKIITSVMGDEDVDTEEKLQVLSKLGETVTTKDFEYYQVAALENDIKTGFVLDEIASIKDGERVDFLAELRKPVLGKMVLADGVIDDLYNQDLITSAQKKYLKSLDYEKGKDGKYTLKKKSGKAKKIKIGSTPTLKKISIKAPQVAQMAKIDFKIPTSSRVPIRKASTNKPRIKLKDASKRLLSVVR